MFLFNGLHKNEVDFLLINKFNVVIKLRDEDCEKKSATSFKHRKLPQYLLKEKKYAHANKLNLLESTLNKCYPHGNITKKRKMSEATFKLIDLREKLR